MYVASSRVHGRARISELPLAVQERSKLFFVQKLFNMLGMIVGAISPSLIAVGARWYSSSTEVVPCSYVFHGNSSSEDLLHGTLPDQLVYIDVTDTQTISKTGEFCQGDEGDFCFEVRSTHKWHLLRMKLHPMFVSGLISVGSVLMEGLLCSTDTRMEHITGMRRPFQQSSPYAKTSH